MMWKDKPLGIVVDDQKIVDLAKLKEEGLAFVVAYAGSGPIGRDSRFAQVVQEAYDLGLPVIAAFTPWPAREMITQDQNPVEQIENIKYCLKHKYIHAFMVSVDRYWTGTDYEDYQKGKRSDIRIATDSNISATAKAVVETMDAYFRSQGKSIPVMVRTNDNFVKGYSPSMANWVGNFPFYLADWRYRYPDPASGQYTKYEIYKTIPTPVASLDDLREQMPPDTAKNPLIPGNNTQMKFWEFSGRRFIHPAVKGLDGALATAEFVLFNGSLDAMNSVLGVSVNNNPPAPIEEEPEEDQSVEDEYIEPSELVEEFYRRLEAAITAAALVWLTYYDTDDEEVG